MKTSLRGLGLCVFATGILSAGLVLLCIGRATAQIDIQKQIEGQGKAAKTMEPVEIRLPTIEEARGQAKGLGRKVRVLLSTTKGNILLELYPDKAPRTVANFLDYVRSGFYTGTIFHRVMKDFMIQCGGYDENLARRPTRSPVPLEADNGLKNEEYSVAMARTDDPDSATSEFFINVKYNADLNFRGKYPGGFGYTVFGRVVTGKNVVDAIKYLKVHRVGPHEHMPFEIVKINCAVVAEEPPAGR